MTSGEEKTKFAKRYLAGLSTLIERTFTELDEMETMSFSDVILKYGKEPYVCKRIGREVPNFDVEDWRLKLFYGLSEDGDLKLLTDNRTPITHGLFVDALIAKAMQDEEVMKALDATNDRIIVESSAKDSMWGTGCNASQVLKNGEYPGSNLLGRMWMGARMRLLL